MKKLHQKLNYIVLVDDNQAHNLYHKFELQEAKCANSIFCFEDVNEALVFFKQRLAENDAPELLLLDINMPAMQGHRFLEKIAEISATALDQMKTVFFSATEMPKATKLHPKAADFMIKPIDQPAIEQILSKHFPEYYN